MSTGYNQNFIGNNIIVPIPRLTSEIEALATFTIGNNPTQLLKYYHYSVLMNNRTKQPILTACNIDQSRFLDTKSKGYWKRDSRIRDEDQLEDHYYVSNPWDKGHMVMRYNTSWGDTKHEAQMADDDSYYYTNAAFQHENMNRDEWKSLEINVERKFAEDSNNKLCVFTGPIHSDLDRYYSRTWHDTVRIPSGFFKVICYQNKPNSKFNPNGLGVKAFIMFQDDEIIKDRSGSKSIKFKEYQVTIREIEEYTGLDFGQEIFDANPLFFHDSEVRREKYNVAFFPERIPIDNSDNILDHDENRLHVDYYSNRKLSIVSALVNPVGADRGNEWVTLLNSSSETISLNGKGLLDNRNRGILLNGQIQPGESLRISGDVLLPIKLVNTGGSLRIVSYTEDIFELVDYVRWSENDVKMVEEGVALTFGNIS